MDKLEAAKAAYLDYRKKHEDDLDFMLVYILPLTKEEQNDFFEAFPDFPRIKESPFEGTADEEQEAIKDLWDRIQGTDQK